MTAATTREEPFFLDGCMIDHFIGLDLLKINDIVLSVNLLTAE
jgi:hypothetical protein